jgi:hypothetical protein
MKKVINCCVVHPQKITYMQQLLILIACDADQAQARGHISCEHAPEPVICVANGAPTISGKPILLQLHALKTSTAN